MAIPQYTLYYSEPIQGLVCTTVIPVSSVCTLLDMFAAQVCWNAVGTVWVCIGNPSNASSRCNKIVYFHGSRLVVCWISVGCGRWTFPILSSHWIPIGIPLDTLDTYWKPLEKYALPEWQLTPGRAVHACIALANRQSRHRAGFGCHKPGETGCL